MDALIPKLEMLVEQEAVPFGLFYVGHEMTEEGAICLMVDSQEPLNMKVLTDFTRHVSTLIDEGNFGEEAFTIEISSPGADRPLVDLRQFHKHVGRNFEIQTQDETFRGELLRIEGDTLHFLAEFPDKGRKVRTEPRLVPYSHINQATIVLKFK